MKLQTLTPTGKQTRVFKLIVWLTLMFAGREAIASHMMGADMSYVCLGNGKYHIIAKVYRDCRGISFANPDFGCYAGKNGGNGCGSSTLAPTRTKIADITPRCSTESKPCNPTNTYNTGEGVEEHTYEITVDFNASPLKSYLNNSNCCEVTFYIGQSARNGAITTGPAGQYFVSTCMINICNIPKTTNKCNSSPQLSNQPIGFLCCNQPYYFNNGAIDTVDYDSFSYALVPGLQGLPASSVSYSSPFSYRYPMTPYCTPPNNIKCTPLPNGTPPKGFFMDTSTGDIIFTPTKCDEVGIVVIEITEWRKDSATGAYIVVGKTRRDMQLIVKDDCGYNKTPTIQGPTVNKVCEGDKICFSIYGKDETFTPYQTVPDTVLMTWNGGIPGATFKIKNPKDREKEAEFCWQTKLGQASDIAYSFTVTITDQHCKPPANAIRGFKVKVNPRAFDTRKYTVLKCGRFAFAAVPPSGFKGVPSYKWSFRDSNGNNEFYFSSKKTDTLTFYKGGKYIVVHTVNNSDNCPTIYRDTIIVPPPPKVVTATKDTFACYKTTIKLTAQVYNAKLPYKYYWTRPVLHMADDTNQTLVVPNVLTDSTLMVKVTDADGCKFYDTATVFVKPLPAKPGIPDQRICTYETATFDAKHNDTMRYIWSTGDTVRLTTVHVAGDYSVVISDPVYHCKMYDTAHLFVNDTVVALAGKDVTICHNDKFTISAAHRNAALSATYSWADLTNKGTTLGSNATYQVQPKNSNSPGQSAQYFAYELYVKITQGGHTCDNRDTMVIKVNTLPKVGWNVGTQPARCWSYGDINLEPLVVNPPLNLWNSNNVRIYGNNTKYGVYGLVDSLNYNQHKFRTTKINNGVDLVSPKTVTDVITLWFKDTNGCVNTANTTQVINGNPVIELDTNTYCQDLGEAALVKGVKKPATFLGVVQNYTVLTVPAGVNPSNVLLDKSGSAKDWWLEFGTPVEDFYAGTYKLKYDVTNQLTGCSSSDTMVVYIVTEPKVTYTTPDPVCQNWDSLDLSDYVQLNNARPRINAQNWFTLIAINGDRNDPAIPNIKLGQGHMFSPNVPAGGYQYKFSSIETGCLKADSFEITVNPVPKTTLLPDITLCEGTVLDLSTRVFSMNPTGGNQVWVGPNVNNGFFTATGKDSATIEGPYKLRFDYTIASTGCTDTQYTKISVRSLPEVVITTAKPASGCENSPFGVQSNRKWADNGLQWATINGSDGSFDNAGADNITYTHGSGDKTNHFAWLKVTTKPIANEVCPQAADSIQIVLYPYPVVDFTNPVAQCAPFTADFTGIESSGIPAGNLAWKWDFGNGDTSNLQNPTGILYQNQGKFQVKLTVTNTLGPCPTTKTVPDYVLAYPKPAAGFVTDPPYKTTIALPKFKTFNRSTLDKSVFTGGYMTYNWDFDDPVLDPNDTSTQFEPRWSYGKDTNTYTIRLIVRSDFGCLDTWTQNVHVGPDIIVFIPDVFSPDGAGPQRNNSFMITAQNYKTATIRVYNRWGEKLWETDDITKGWDGTANGALCQQGVFVYHVEITSMEDKLYQFDGTVTLIR